MDHGSTEWKDGLLEVTLAMNTQIHSTIGCAPAELLFRDRSSHINWLNSQARKDLLIGVEHEDQTMAPILERELEQQEQQEQQELEALIDPRLRTVAYSPSLSLSLSLSLLLSPELQLNSKL
jgi:hypothetical protein